MTSNFWELVKENAMWCALRPTILFMFRGVSIYYIDSTNHVLLHYFAELVVLFIYYRKTPRTQNDNVMEDLCVVYISDSQFGPTISSPVWPPDCRLC